MIPEAVLLLVQSRLCRVKKSSRSDEAFLLYTPSAALVAGRYSRAAGRSSLALWIIGRAYLGHFRAKYRPAYAGL
jgi:hypothetical protein